VYRRGQVHELLTCGRGGLVGYQGVAILQRVIGLLARRSTSTALLNSVPRLNQGLDLLRRLADAGDAEARLKHLQHGFD
jgi:hypothetical protein